MLLISRVRRTVLTDENTSKILDVSNDPQLYDEAREHRLTKKDVQKLMENPERSVMAASRTAESRDFLGRFVTQIRVHTEKAVVHYSVPMPEDSPLTGTRRQEVDPPEEVLA